MKIRPGFTQITAYLIVDDALKALDFYEQTFGATKTYQVNMGEKIGHAEVRIGDAMLMISSEFLEYDIKGPNALGGAGANLYLYVEDVDDTCEGFRAAGGQVLREPKDEVDGDRRAMLKDPFGHIWHVATHQREVPAREVQAFFDRQRDA